jgi:hypothetical protein
LIFVVQKDNKMSKRSRIIYKFSQYKALHPQEKVIISLKL